MLPKDDVELEVEINRVLGLQGTKNSGAVHNDGDGKGRVKDNDTYDQLLVDGKFTQIGKKTISIKKHDFNKTDSSARRFGRVPLMGTYQAGDDDIFIHMTLDDFAIMYKNHLEYTKINNET